MDGNKLEKVQIVRVKRPPSTKRTMEDLIVNMDAFGKV